MTRIRIGHLAGFGGGLAWWGAWLGLVSALTAAQTEAVSPFSKGPYVQAPSPGTVIIMWESLSNHPGSVRFGPNTSLGQEIASVVPRELKSFGQTGSGSRSSWPVRTFYLYEATLENLRPGAAYSYTVELDGTRTPPRQFRTLDSAAKRVRFIAYGDSRSNPDKHRAVVSHFLEYKPDFILHAGDLVVRGEDYDLWSREFFAPLADVMDRVPFFSVLGNHEQDGTNYVNFLHLPGKRRWYSFDAGPVHVLALDFHFEKADSEQYQFAQQDLLASHAPWKIVSLHTPLYNIGGHASAWGHADFLPLFHQAKVDLVIAGHSHMYERFRPLSPAGQPDGWAITHLTTGGGGAGLVKAVNHPALETLEASHHFMVFEVDRKVLRAKAIRTDGTLIDSFEIRKTRGQLSPSYLAQAYTEDSLNLFYETVPSLGGHVAALPTSTAPTEVRLSILPRKNGAGPAELEIGIAPESAAHYEVAGELLHTTTPPLGQTNTVRIMVRTKNQLPVTETSTHELVPPLVLQAKVTTANGQTVAYGARSRLDAP